VAGQELSVRVAVGSNAIQVSSPTMASQCAGCADVQGVQRIEMNGAPLSRRVTVWADGQGGLTTVAWLDLEDYLRGVLAGEVPYRRWAPEALKAQAVVSRSYALYQMKTRQAEPYDVETTTASQVFKLGVGNEPILQRAIDATRGQVVTCNGKLFPAYFHSTCGGTTTEAKRVWPARQTAATLCGTRCAFCKASPAYEWSWQVSKTELGRRLGLGRPVLTIETVPDKSGRAETVRVRYASGTRTFAGNQFRLLVSARELKSMRWTRVQDTGTQFRFEGRGYGHGVGMCQYGSDGMARAGYSCEQILGLYYPGGELTTLYGMKTAAR
jgi:stage II sporulation protein D